MGKGPGGKHDGSCIIWPNGEVDPWSSRGIRKNSTVMSALWVPGASHHAWTSVGGIRPALRHRCTCRDSGTDESFSRFGLCTNSGANNNRNLAVVLNQLLSTKNLL